MPSRRVRLESLTGLRALAALFVFLFHLQASGVTNAITEVGRFGYIGVGFFYMLSGVVLVYSYRPEQSDGRFYWLRAARVVPLYLAVLLAAWLTNVLQGEGLKLQAFAAAVLLVQAWIPDREIYFGVQPVFWSLSVEAFFYLCFPWIYRHMRPLRDQHLGVLAIALYLGVLIVAGLGRSFEGFAFWFVYVAPPVRMLEFLVGMVLAEALRRGIVLESRSSSPARHSRRGLPPCLTLWRPSVLLPSCSCRSR